jgi:glutamate racemase
MVDNRPYGEQVKEKLQELVLKLLDLAKSRKFWACLLGCLAALTGPDLDPSARIASIVSLIIAYAGFSVWDDHLTRKDG